MYSSPTASSYSTNNKKPNNKNNKNCSARNNITVPTMFLPLSFLLLLPLMGTTNGYLVGRLLSLQNVADAHRQLLAATTSGDQRVLLQPPLVFSAYSPNRMTVDVDGRQQKEGGGADEDVLAEELANDEPIVYAKKSLHKKNLGGGGYKALNKFNGGGSRNCFFTPIQCMIQHDMSKYKKLVDSDIRLQLSG